MNLNIAAFASYGINENFSVQAELNFMINQGFKLSSSIASAEYTYTSLDIPVLIKYKLLDNPLLLGVLAGPYVSIPMGKIKYSVSGYGDVEYDTDGIAVGLTAGLYAGYPMGSGRIVGDLRFLYDLTVTKAKSGSATADFIKRRAFAFTAGYEISF